MAKIQLKSGNINPFGGLFSIFKQFDRSGLRRTIDSTLGHRGTTRAAFSYGDVFASLFGSYLCGGDCNEDVMEIKPFWDGREDIRVCSSAVLGEKIKLPFKLHIHCARHSFGTNGLNNGCDIKSISALMGHSSVLTTEKVYAAVLPETLQKTVEKSLNFKI